jgi:hypothetical protein
LSLKPKVDGLSVVWPQNHWDGFFWFGLKTGGYGFSRFGLKTDGGGFSGLGLKTGNYGLVIWASKSQQRFLSLGLKTKWATICQLRDKTDGRMTTAQGMRRDLVACFAWKQVGLGFPSLPQNWCRRDGSWCTWHNRRCRVEVKLKMDGLIRGAASDPATLALLFSL